ncbi:hypothetical protein GCM10020331_090460 [Ectobacillus funiculus]
MQIRLMKLLWGTFCKLVLAKNPARQAAIAAGLPQEVSALTINKVCGSGLKAVHLATQAILSGDADIVVAGGMEKHEPSSLPFTRGS